MQRLGRRKWGHDWLRGMTVAALLLSNMPFPISSPRALEDDGASWTIPRFIMTSSDGRTLSDGDLRGQHLLVFFGYTNCPDICPTGLQVISEAMDILGTTAGAVQPIFVTLDPERDTKPVLASYVTHFHPRLLALTGGAEMVDRVAEGFHVRHQKVMQPGEDPSFYGIDHTAAIFHIGPDGRYLGRFPPGTTAAAVAERIREVLAEASEGE